MPTTSPDSLSNQHHRTISARVSPDLHNAVIQLAQKRGESINNLVEALLEREVSQDAEKVLYDSFTLLGADSESAEANVDFAFEAQAEVAGA